MKKFESIVFPEIPCSYDGVWADEDEFEECVEDALDELVAANIISNSDKSHFKNSMRKAFQEAQ